MAACGVALLAAGFFLRSQPARLAALAVIALTIAKVFIIDTASISGIYRAISVIGLGVVLLCIGWLYQPPLYPRPAAACNLITLVSRSDRHREEPGGGITGIFPASGVGALIFEIDIRDQVSAVVLFSLSLKS